jgi:hypothetical protein
MKIANADPAVTPNLSLIGLDVNSSGRLQAVVIMGNILYFEPLKKIKDGVIDTVWWKQD